MSVELSYLEELVGLESRHQHPPVHQWNPELSGDMDMVIRKDGSWWHEGSKIEREKLVQLFASILRKEGDDFFILTPVEKWRIQVEDRPFLINMIEEKGSTVHAISNVGDLVAIGKNHPLTLSMIDGERVPEVEVRDGLMARFSRNAYYDLVALSQEKIINNSLSYIIRSGNMEFVIG